MKTELSTFVFFGILPANESAFFLWNLPLLVFS